MFCVYQSLLQLILSCVGLFQQPWVVASDKCLSEVCNVSVRDGRSYEILHVQHTDLPTGLYCTR